MQLKDLNFQGTYLYKSCTEVETEARDGDCCMSNITLLRYAGHTGDPLYAAVGKSSGWLN